MPDFSLNEVSAKAKLAARGAGYSWGMAEEISRSVYWLVNRNLPGPQMLVGLLNSYSCKIADNAPENVPDSAYGTASNSSSNALTITNHFPQSANQPIQSNASWLCPVACACAFSDHFNTIDATIQWQFVNVRFSGLMLAILADLACRNEKTLLIETACSRILTNGVTTTYSSNDPFLTEEAKLVTVSVVDNSTQAEPVCVQPVDRAIVSMMVWTRLDEFAHRTYAPATDASRILGAGAGLSDND